MMSRVKKRSMGEMEFVEGGLRSIQAVWISATLLIWVFQVLNIPGLIKVISMI